MASDIHCSVEGCPNTIPNHYWSKVKSEWFVQKDGQRFCPDHIPAWVEPWRKKQQEEKEYNSCLVHIDISTTDKIVLSCDKHPQWFVDLGTEPLLSLAVFNSNKHKEENK